MAFITCENVSFSYENTSVIRNLNFSVDKGDYLCIVGENGSGKSTLIKGILGLKSPAHGKITRGDGLKKNETGYLPQQTPAQKDFPASVYEVVLSGRSNSRGWRPFYSRLDKQTAIDNIKRLNIEHLLKRSYRDLSGGQTGKQRGRGIHPQFGFFLFVCLVRQLSCSNLFFLCLCNSLINYCCKSCTGHRSYDEYPEVCKS